MRKTRAPTQSQRAIGHITALPFIATMFVMYAMVGRSPLQFKMPRLDAYLSLDVLAMPHGLEHLTALCAWVAPVGTCALRRQRGRT